MELAGFCKKELCCGDRLTGTVCGRTDGQGSFPQQGQILLLQSFFPEDDGDLLAQQGVGDAGQKKGPGDLLLQGGFYLLGRDLDAC